MESYRCGDDFLFKCLASSPSPLVPESDTPWLWLRVVGFLGILGAGGYLISIQAKAHRELSGCDQRKMWSPTLALWVTVSFWSLLNMDWKSICWA